MALETDFSQLLDNVFDIAHADSESLIKIKQDWAFLRDQRGPREMIMTSEDKQFRKTEDKKQKRKQEEMRRWEKQKIASAEAVAVTISSDEEETEEKSTVSDDDPAIRQFRRKCSRYSVTADARKC